MAKANKRFISIYPDKSVFLTYYDDRDLLVWVNTEDPTKIYDYESQCSLGWEYEYAKEGDANVEAEIIEDPIEIDKILMMAELTHD